LAASFIRRGIEVSSLSRQATAIREMFNAGGPAQFAPREFGLQLSVNILFSLF
jgi:hypothetical protein